MNITVSLHSIYDISERETSFTVKYSFVLSWIDPILAFKPYQKNNVTVDKFTLPEHLLKLKGTTLLLL